jgi:hypothetical protein
MMEHASTNLQYLVVGTGRSGTVYTAKLLTALGIPCGHELIFNGGNLPDALRIGEQGGKNSACSTHCGLDFQVHPIAESSYMAVPFLQHECLKSCTIIHVVRDPLQVIRSFLNNLLFFREDRNEYRRAEEQFLYTHLPHLDFLPDPVSRACYYYLRWNQMIEESIAGRKYLLYPIERGPQVLLNFMGCAADGVALPDATCNAYSKWPDHMRVATNLPVVTDEEIKDCFLWKEVATLGGKYGYAHPVPESRLEQAPAGRRSQRSASSQPRTETPVFYPIQPRMVQENYYKFNIVQYKDAFFAVHQEAGPLDLSRLSKQELDNLKANGRLISDGSLPQLKEAARWGASERRQAELQAELRNAQDRVGRLERDLQTAFEAIRRTEAEVVRLCPWYRKVGRKVRRGWHYVRDSVLTRKSVRYANDGV